MADDFSAVTKQLIEDRQARQKELEAQKELLSKMATELESAGMIAEDNAEYNKKSNELKQQELKFRLKGADSPSARKEIKAEQAAAAKKNQGILGKIAGGITDIAKNTLMDKVKGAGKGIMAILKGTLIAGFFLAVVAFLESKYWTDTKAFIVDKIVPMLVNFYENILKPIGVIFKDYFIATWKNIKELFSGLGKSFDLFAKGEWWEGIKTLVSSIGTFLGDQVDAILTAVYNSIAVVFGLGKTDSVFGSIWGLLTDTYNEFVSWISTSWSNIKTTISTTWTNIKDSVVKAFTDIKDWIVGVFTWASEGVAGGWTIITNFIKGEFFCVVGFFKGLWTWASEGVAGAWTGITNFVTTQFGSVVTFIKDLFTWPDSPAGFAIKLIDLVLLPYNLAINFIRDIFGWGDPDESFSLGTFVVDIFKKVKDWFTKIFDFKVSDVLPDLEMPDFGEMIKGVIRAVFPTSLFDKSFLGYSLKDFLPDSLTKFLTEEPDKKLASGGSFKAGQSLLVGELGPELILPSTGGQVKSAERTQQIQAAGLRRGADGSGTSGPAVVNAPVNTVNNSQNNTSVTATPITNQTPIMQLVNAAN